MSKTIKCRYLWKISKIWVKYLWFYGVNWSKFEVSKKKKPYIWQYSVASANVFAIKIFWFKHYKFFFTDEISFVPSCSPLIH